MSSIKNAEQLRDYVLNSLEKLEKNKIDIEKMSIIAKSSETVMSSIKMQLAYANMRQEMPIIPFLQDCHKVEKKQLENKK